MRILTKLIFLLIIFILSGCNPVRVEYFDIEPKDLDFYKTLTKSKLIINPSFRPLTQNILSESHVTYTTPYMFRLSIENGINQKQRILKKLIPINIYLLENGYKKVAQEELSDLKKWRTTEIGNPLYPEDFSTEFYTALKLEIDWKNLESIIIYVEFKAIFEENGKEHEKIYKKEIKFVPYHKVQDTTGFSRLVV